MRAGLYEARSLIGEKKIAYVVLEDDAATLRRRLTRAVAALRYARHRTGGRTRELIMSALSDVEEG